VLEVDSPVEGRFTKADIAFMRGFANLLGVAIERQDSESALRVSDTSLRQALNYQEVISKEINHRVKNSLSIIAGLLNMQARSSLILMSGVPWTMRGVVYKRLPQCTISYGEPMTFITST
jgi:hypothetical protein